MNRKKNVKPRVPDANMETIYIQKKLIAGLRKGRNKTPLFVKEAYLPVACVGAR